MTMAYHATQRDGGPMPMTYELSPAQHSMLAHHLRAPASGEYHEQIVGELREAVDVIAMERAWRRAIGQHPVLRTAFTWESLEGPVQVVHDEVPFGISVLDWRGVEPALRRQRLDALLAEDRATPFDLARAPLVRVRLVCLGAEQWLLTWSAANAILDGASFPLVLADVFLAYDAYRVGAEPALPPRPPFREYIDWLRSRDTAADERFWRATLSGATLPTQIPGGGAIREPLGHRELDVALDAATTEALREVARRQDVDLRTLVYGAWGLLLARHAGTSEVTFGIVDSVRTALADAHSMTGLCTHTAPLRLDVPRRMPAAEWLRTVAATHAAMAPHAHAAPADVRRWSGVLAGLPLFESVVIYDDATLDTRTKRLPGDWANRQFVLHERASHPLVVYAWGEQTLRLRLVWDRGRLDDDAAAAVSRELVALLRALPHGEAEPLAAFLMPATAVHADVAVAAPTLTTLTMEFPSCA